MHEPATSLIDRPLSRTWAPSELRQSLYATLDRELLPFSAITIGILVVVVADTLHGWFRLIAWPVDMDYWPMPVRVAMALRGYPLYGEFRHGPYVPLLYGPVVPLAVARLSRFLAVGAAGSLEIGRLLIVASTLMVSVLIFLLARRSGVSRSSSIIASLAFLVSPFVQIWGFAFRVDMPALASELGGLWLFAAGFPFAAVAMFVISFFTKQLRMAGIAAVMLFCLLNGERRRAITLGVVWLATVTLLTTIAQSLSPYYWLNTVEALVPIYDSYAAPRFVAGLVSCNVALVSLAVPVLRRSSLRSLPVCFLLVAFAQDAATSIHWGSNYYYLLPTLAALTLFAAQGLDGLLKQAATLPVFARAVFAVALAVILCPLWIVSGGGLARVARAARGDIARSAPFSWNEAALRRLRSIHGTVMTDLPGLAVDNPSGNVEFIELMSIGAMRERGRLDDRPLISAIKAGKIGGFALDQPLLEKEYRGRAFFWPQLRRAILQNYALVRDRSGRAVGPPYLMVPKAAR